MSRVTLSATPAMRARVAGFQPFAAAQPRMRSRTDVRTGADGETETGAGVCMAPSVVIFDEKSIRSPVFYPVVFFDDATTIPAMTKDPYSADARRRVLQAFIDRNKLKVQTWTTAAGMSESVVRHFLEGRSESMSDRTYARLAAGATKLLERKVDASALRGDKPPEIEIPIHHFVGAGDEVHLFDDNAAFDYTAAPPGFQEGGAGIVRGDSMLPIFEPGDVLFWRHLERPPANPPKRAVIVKVKDGPLLVKKLLPGTKKGLYYLLSVNPHTPVLADQPVEAIARIGWVKPSEA